MRSLQLATIRNRIKHEELQRSVANRNAGRPSIVIELRLGTNEQWDVIRLVRDPMAGSYCAQSNMEIVQRASIEIQKEDRIGSGRGSMSGTAIARR
jgi:hypothetical protein